MDLVIIYCYEGTRVLENQSTGKNMNRPTGKKENQLPPKPIRLKNHPALIYPVTSRHHNIPNQLINRLYRIFKLNLNLIPYTAGCNTGANVYTLQYFHKPLYETH
jgi:hypothetical protein